MRPLILVLFARLPLNAPTVTMLGLLCYMWAAISNQDNQEYEIIMWHLIKKKS